ncbi:MAG: transcriptional regulator PpsR [Rhizobiaceae bacterium]|nr:transcriptional regulator PpsR [Rhizobiaceae bacterium]
MVSTLKSKAPALAVDPRTVAGLVAAAADLTLVLDADDIVRDILHTLTDLPGARLPAWIGLPVTDIVRPEQLATLRAMLRATRDGRPAKKFEIGHPLGAGRELPMQYSAVSIGANGDVALVGRDLRVVADLQSRLVASRRTAEQSGQRQRQAEAHYRLLFETAGDAMIVVDAESSKIREANPRAAALLGSDAADLAGRKVASAFDKPHQGDVQALVGAVLASGLRETVRLPAQGGRDRLSLAAELFRAGDLKLVMIRLEAAETGAGGPAGPDQRLVDLVRDATEAVLLSDEDGLVVWTNEAFLILAGLPLAAHAIGKPLETFFHWHGIDEDVLLADVRRRGRLALFSGTVRGANGQSSEVELSAVARTEGGRPSGYAFVMRPRSEEATQTPRGNSDLMRTAESLSEMIGRVPMKDLVRDTTDVIERMCIEAALKLTGDNRASAARVLGLSRQALYLKMHRFGIVDEE